MTTLQLDSRIIKGLTKEEAVQAVANTKATIKELKNDIEVITNENAKTGKSRIQYVGMYVDAVLQFVEDKVAHREAAVTVEEQAPVVEVAKEEEATMTNNTPVTVEAMNKQMMEMMEGFMTILNNTMEAQSKQLSTTLQGMDERMDKASRYTKQLEKRIEALTTPQAPVSEAPMVEGTPVEVDLEQIVYTPEQMAALDNIEKTGSPEEYNRVLASMNKMNKAMGHTVGNVLNRTSAFIDDKGHKGVNSVSDLVGKTIDSAKSITHSLIDLTATTLHSANEIGRTAGHIIINGVVYTIDAAGNMITKK